MNRRRQLEETAIASDFVIDATRHWIEKAVLGLGLCPFAESVYRGRRVRFHVCEERTIPGMLEDLHAELTYLNAVGELQVETTLFIHPLVLTDFDDFNDFLKIGDDAITLLGLEGEIQIASFHPRYQFSGTQQDDIENYTNRSPYPTLHLLREASVERALAAVPDVDAIGQNNIQRLRNLGMDGWRALWLDQRCD